jgi:predicted acyl esterase
VEIWPTSLVLPAGYRIALTVRGRDYEYPKARGDRLSTFRNELRGSGPFLHDDPDDRPADVFGRTVTLHVGGRYSAQLLLPFVPES